MLLTTVTLRLFFYGLIAFTPDEFQCQEKMRALVLDAHKPPIASDGCPIHPHTAEIIFESTTCNTACQDGIHCKQDSDTGLCRCRLLARYLLDVGSRESSGLCQNEKPTKPPGRETCDSSDFKFITKLKDQRLLGLRHRMRLKDACDQSCPAVNSSLCDLIKFQVNFNPINVNACSFSATQPNEPRKASKINLKPLSSRNLWNATEQHTAEIIMFTHAIEVPEPNPKILKLKLTPIEGEHTPTLEVPINEEFYADVLISNSFDPEVHKHMTGRCGSDLIGRDFELFHDLTAHPLHPSDRPSPQVREPVEYVEIPTTSETAPCGNSPVLTAWVEYLIAEESRSGKNRSICPETAISSD